MAIFVSFTKPHLLHSSICSHISLTVAASTSFSTNWCCLKSPIFGSFVQCRFFCRSYCPPILAGFLPLVELELLFSWRLTAAKFRELIFPIFGNYIKGVHDVVGHLGTFIV